MPTINRYANEQGYYIRARPSNAGNITYKIRDEGNSVIWKYGLRDGDDISWSLVQLFKVLKIIYTEKSGTLGPDDFKPDPEQLEETKLAESDAQKLFSIITTLFELSHNERTEIRSILGLSLEIDFKAIGDRLKLSLESYINQRGFPIRDDQMIKNTENIDISTWVEEDNSTDYDSWHLRILIISKVGNDSYFTEHCIHLCNKHGLEYWHIRVLETPTWDIKQVAIKQKSILFPLVLDELRTAEFNLGDPTEMLSPQIGRTGIGSAE